ncbi:MAG: urea transport system permease protein, partial [Paraglaciecola sp.]
MDAYTNSELISIFAMQGFAGFSLFSVLLLMALGLAIIFGQMGVINMAHGEFMAVGAYTTYFMATMTETYFPAFMPYYFVFAIIAAFFVA